MQGFVLCPLYMPRTRKTMGNADLAVIYERSKVFNYLERHDHLFVSGSAGMGKTSLLRELSDSVRGRVDVLFTAMTASAANQLAFTGSNHHASTFHSFCGIGGCGTELASDIRRISKQASFKSNIQTCRSSIIDEASMFCSSMLDRFDEVATHSTITSGT
jgi:1,4-alpha-glucan branching enzyme